MSPGQLSESEQVAVLMAAILFLCATVACAIRATRSAAVVTSDSSLLRQALREPSGSSSAV